MKTKNETKVLPATIEPFEFLPGFDTPEIQEFHDTIRRYMDISNLLEVLDKFSRSSYLTESEKENIIWLTSKFRLADSCLYERLGFDL